MLVVSDCSAICPSRSLLNRGGEGQGIYGGGPGPTIGALTLRALALYLAACSLSRGVLRLWGHTFTLPRLRDAVGQVALDAVDNALAIGAFWMVLPPRAVVFPRFIIDYSVAYVRGALSGVPGGAGPFAGLLVKLLPARQDKSRRRLPGVQTHIQSGSAGPCSRLTCRRTFAAPRRTAPAPLAICAGL